MSFSYIHIKVCTNMPCYKLSYFCISHLSHGIHMVFKFLQYVLWLNFRHGMLLGSGEAILESRWRLFNSGNEFYN